MEEGPVLPVSSIEWRLEPGRHPLEALAGDAIDEGWRRRIAARPRLHDGEVVLGTRLSVADGRLTGACQPIRYAGLLHFLENPDTGLPQDPYRHLFAWPALISADGRAVMGRMASHTANPGRIYFPAGSLEASDFVGELADIDANMAREVREETGLDLGAARPDPGYLLLPAGRLALVMRIFRFRQNAADLAGAAREFLAARHDDELDAILDFAPGETDPAMTPLARRFMRWFSG
jgi:8-oxo-dGTP pyrophosphatase MutT (NUDIX family)